VYIDNSQQLEIAHTLRVEFWLTVVVISIFIVRFRRTTLILSAKLVTSRYKEIR